MREGEPQINDRHSTWKPIAFVMLLFGLMAVLPALLEDVPRSGGLSVSEWLYQSNEDFARQGVTQPNAGQKVEEFGPEAIPLIIEQFHTVRPPASGVYENLCTFLPLPKHTQPDIEELRRRCYFALSVLGRQHPEKVDPFFHAQLTTEGRHEAISWLGALGPRHLPTITNLLNGTDGSDANAAIHSLYHTGTNTTAFNPLIIHAINRHAGTNKLFRNHIYKMSWDAEQHDYALTGLIELLSHPSLNVQRDAFGVLLCVTNQFERLRPVFAQVASRSAAKTADLGDVAVRILHETGVPYETAVPILIDRLRQFIELEPNPMSSILRIESCLVAMANYGPPAEDAVPLVEKLLDAMPPDLEEAYQRTSRRTPTKRDIEFQLRKIEPSWTRPPSP